VHPETVRDALTGRMEYSWKRPRRKLPPPSEPDFAERIGRIDRAVANAGPQTTVLFEDETEFKRFPPLRRAWISESLDELETLVSKERDAQVQRRFHMLLLFASGEAESRAAVARQLKVHRNTVSDWLDLYKEGGLDGMREFGTPGPESGQQSIPPGVMQALKVRLSDGGQGFASYKEIRRWPAEEHSVDLTYSTVHGIVRYQIGAKPKAPRPSHPKKRAVPSNSLPRRASSATCGPQDAGEPACTPVLPRRVPGRLDAGQKASDYRPRREADQSAEAGLRIVLHPAELSSRIPASAFFWSRTTSGSGRVPVLPRRGRPQVL
jgi:transposase